MRIKLKNGMQKCGGKNQTYHMAAATAETYLHFEAVNSQVLSAANSDQ